MFEERAPAPQELAASPNNVEVVLVHAIDSCPGNWLSSAIACTGQEEKAKKLISRSLSDSDSVF